MDSEIFGICPEEKLVGDSEVFFPLLIIIKKKKKVNNDDSVILCATLLNSSYLQTYICNDCQVKP